MSEVRSVALIKITDPARAADVTRRGADFIAQNLPDTEVWEFFADDVTGKGLMYQVHANEQAWLAYEAAMTGQGYQAELFEAAELEQIILLSPVTDPDVKKALDEFGGVTMERIAGVSR
jgi:hypothetical protein